MFVSAALVTVAEAGTHGPITDYGDGLWWATATITTVGYGDMVPTSDFGRAVAAALMLAGITLFGILTANLASFFLERTAKDAETREERIEAKLDELLRRIAALEQPGLTADLTARSDAFNES